MASIIRILSCISILFLLAGCADKPVRHLASDASLIVVGTSTKNDVLTFLGDPDEQQFDPPSAERWVYLEENPSDLQKTPYFGKMFAPKGNSRIIIIFEGEKVADCKYYSYDSDEFDWADDYSWQEKRP